MKLTILITASLLLFTKLNGQEFKFKFETEINPGVSYSKLTGLGFSSGFRQRIFFTNHFALEGEGIYSFSWRNLSTGNSFNNNQRKYYDSFSYGGSLYYQLNKDHSGLYLAAGLIKNPLGLDIVSRLGYKYTLNKKLFLTTEAVHTYYTGKAQEGEGRGSFLIKIGVGIRF